MERENKVKEAFKTLSEKLNKLDNIQIRLTATRRQIKGALEKLAEEIEKIEQRKWETQSIIVSSDSD